MVVEYANYLESKGHDVVILTNIVDTVFDVQTRVDAISHSNKSKLETIRKALISKIDSDIIIADIIVMVLLLSFRNRKRLLCFAQDYDESYYKNPVMKLLIRVVYFYCLRILHIPVIAVSEELGQLLSRRFNADVTVVPNGVDTNVFYPDRDEKYLALKGDSKAILVFARSDYRKGFDIAVKVLSNFRKEIENGSITVWVVGENIEVPFKIRHFGFAAPDSLRKILSCSDMLLYPSRHEGLPLFVLEAMACGCPVVTTDAANIAIHEVNALVCRIGNIANVISATRRMLYDNPMRKNIIFNGLSEAGRYTLAKSTLNFEEQLYSIQQNTREK